MIQLKFFGRLAEITGGPCMEIKEVNSINQLLKMMKEEFPELGKCNFLISINKKLVKGEQALQDGDEVAFLPPFAGG